jgi:hypothetical protein
MLDKLDRRLMPELRYAQGKRAVEDALRLAKLGDQAGRDAGPLHR